MTTLLFQKTPQNKSNYIMYCLACAALNSKNYTPIFEPEQSWDKIREVTKIDKVLICDTYNLGPETLKFPKETDFIFINCEPPGFLKNKKNRIQIMTIDENEYVDVSYLDKEVNPEYVCDLLIISTPDLDKSKLSNLPNNTFIVGEPIQHPNYIGTSMSNIIGEFIVSANHVFCENGLLNKAFDKTGITRVEYPGGPVVTNVEGVESYDELLSNICK